MAVKAIADIVSFRRLLAVTPGAVMISAMIKADFCPVFTVVTLRTLPTVMRVGSIVEMASTAV